MTALRPDPAVETVDSALIARASTDHQGDTCEHQIMALQAWAKHLSGANSGERFVIRPQHVFVDDGVSAWKESILERPGVKRFIEAVERGEVQCLFIKGLSRFNRDDAEAKMFFEWLDGKGVRVKSLEEGFDSREKGGAMAIFHVHSFLARMESDKKSIAVKIGMREKMKKGEWKGGIPPYGFRYNPAVKKLEPIDALRPIVEEIWELAAEGKGPVWIAHHFNQTRKWAHVDPRIWFGTAVQRLLTRQVYVGDLVCGIHTYKYTRTLEKSRSGSYLFGKKKRILEMAPEDAIVVENAHQGIISRPLFERVQEQLKRRKREPLQTRKPPNARYPLTGILVCGHCAGPMIHHGRNLGKGYRYYTCANKLRKGKAVCDQENVRSDYLHELVLLSLEQKLEAVQSDTHFWDKWKTVERSMANHGRRVAEIDAEIGLAADNLADFLVKTPNLSDSVRDLVALRAEQKIQKLQAEKTKLHKELDGVSSGQEEVIRLQRDIDELCRKGLQFGPDASAEDLRELFQKWVQRITLHNVKTSGLHRQKDVKIEWKIDVMLGHSG